MLNLARFLVILGIIFLISGGLVYLASRMGLQLGNLPGNIRIQGENFTCVFALGASILLSILLTIALNIFARFMHR
jgi:hypothetical protein